MANGLTSVAALVHHQHIGANANYPTDIALELPVGEADAAGRRVGHLAVGPGVGAVHFGARGVQHTQVLRPFLLLLLLLLAIRLTGHSILLVTPSLNFNIAGWKKRAVGHCLVLHQHAPQRLLLLTHTARLLSMCPAWEHNQRGH